MKIRKFIKTPAYTLDIDFTQCEQKLGFQIHDHIKQLYTRSYGNAATGIIKFSKERVKPLNQWDDWLITRTEEKNYSGIGEIHLLNAKANVTDRLYRMFTVWTGGNYFGRRMAIGEMYLNFGEVLVLINNDTGNIEWIDCAYGYFEVYEENPNGILANSLEEFWEYFI